jgi:nuclear transport factor 2 (NTF2) superfamily protein
MGMIASVGYRERPFSEPELQEELIVQTRPPLPPFTLETARQKVQAAEDTWNTRHPERVALAYTEGSQWRNRDTFFEGRDAIVEFLRRKWARELDYRLRKELWCFAGNRISVRFEYECRDGDGQWWRSHGNEHWEFDENGHMSRRDASINDYRIEERERRIGVGVDPAEPGLG